VSVIGAVLKFLTHLIAFLYVLLIVIAIGDCWNGACNNQVGQPEHLYWMVVFFYGVFGVPACLISFFLLARTFYRSRMKKTAD
jgi:hypothetical protein